MRLQYSLFIVALFFSITVFAMPEKDYKAALRLAEKEVVRKKSAISQVQALSSSLIKTLFGRYYQRGDQWDVAVWQLHPSTLRLTTDPELLKPQVGRGGIFHYEILDVKTGPRPQVTIQITEKPNRQFPSFDPRVERLTLTMRDDLTQGEKIFFFRGQKQPIPVSPNGIHTGISPLDLLPLDVPDISTALKQNPTTAPPLPPRIKEFMNKIGLKDDLSQSAWFEQEDFFGRPIQALWKKGDPWPSYLKTPNGISILIHEGPS